MSVNGEAIIQRYQAKLRTIEQNRRRRRLSTAAAIALTIVVAAAIWQLAPRAAAFHEVSGIVRCTSTAIVTGVYLKEGRGSRQGFAGKHPVNGDPSVVQYQHPVLGRTYALDVGCGGTEALWRMSAHSDFVSGRDNDFLCHDIPGTPHYGQCVRR